MAYTANDLITDALKELGAYQKGETVDSQDAADALSRLNTMLDGWSVEPLAVYHVEETTKALTASTGSYTVGSGGAIDMTRPLDILQAYVRDSTDSADYPLEILRKEQYQRLALKSTTSTLPSALFYDPDHPLATLYLYPVPTSATLTLHFDAVEQLGSFAALTTSFAFPPGFKRALLLNLAVECEGLFGVSARPSTVREAKLAKAAIKRMNARHRPGLVTFEPALRPVVRGSYNIYTDGG